MPRFKALILFALSIIALLAALKLMDWIPIFAGKESIKTFKSVEEVSSYIRINPVMPSYFPQYLKWPPFEILASRKPFQWILMHFRHRDSGEVVLAIGQSHGDKPPVEPRIKQARIIKEEKTFLKGREAIIRIATSKDGSPCNSISWREGDMLIIVMLKDSLDELLNITNSMMTQDTSNSIF